MLPDLTSRTLLAGQVALVTGGGRGLGRAFATALAGAGAALAITGRSADQLGETVRLIEQSGGRALALPADVTDQAAIERAIQTAEERLGPIDLLVNNAGIVGPVALTWEAGLADWWRTLEVNLFGALLCVHAVMPGMVARRRGRIVNIASGAGHGTGQHFSAYATSKASLIRLTEALAVEARSYNVQVFAITPGLVKTAMPLSILQDPKLSPLRPEIRTTIERGEDLPPERAASLVLLLASGAADGLSGCFLTTRDDLPSLIARAGEIQRNRLHTMRLVT